MRTKNRFCVGEGIAGFVNVLSGHYPAGRVALLYQDPEIGQRIASALVKNYKVDPFRYDEQKEKKEDVRFVVGVGATEIIPYVLGYADKTPFAFFAQNVDFRFLNTFDGSGRTAEFAYVDKEVAGSDEGIAGCYASLFSLWCESRLREMERSYLPFCDRTQETLRASAERVLSGDCDREEFLSESFRLVSCFTNAFRDEKWLYTERTAVLGSEPECQFVSAYLLTVLLNNFTKSPFGVMLNPTGEKQRTVYRPIELPKEKMKTFAQRMKAMKSFPEVDLNELTGLFEAVAIPELPILFKWREYS